MYYLAEPNTFSLYYQTFIEMVNAYEFAPTTYPIPTPPPPTYPLEPNLEESCITGDYGSITECVPRDASFPSEVSDILGTFNNLQVPILQ